MGDINKDKKEMCWGGGVNDHNYLSNDLSVCYYYRRIL